MSLTGANWSGRGRLFVAMGLFGAALFYGDGIITPVISVLSALEGFDIATNVFKPPTFAPDSASFRIVMTCALLNRPRFMPAFLPGTH